MHAYRTHTCGALRLTDAGQPARLSGWVHRKRDHGQLLFIDLRDHYGMTQCVIDISSPLFAAADALRLESVVTMTGRIAARSPDTVNPKLDTGEVELVIADIEVRSEAEPLPFPVNSRGRIPRGHAADLPLSRSAARADARQHDAAGARHRLDPAADDRAGLCRVSDADPDRQLARGGARLPVPSRLHPGEFYALPQAPQQFKQMLMVAGFDRYFQIAPCFRDEAGRADRAPGEFYQLDLEMSFVTQEDVFAAIEPVLHGVFEEFGGGRPGEPGAVPAHRLCEAMLQLCDRQARSAQPDRHPDMTESSAARGSACFASMIASDASVRVRAIPAPGGGNRAFCDRMNAWAQGEGAPGLWPTSSSVTARGPGPDRAADIGARADRSASAPSSGVGDGDAVFFVGGAPRLSETFAGAARLKIGASSA